MTLQSMISRQTDKDISMEYCPHCGKKTLVCADGKQWLCAECGFDLYKNTAAAAGLIIEVGGKILLIVRKNDPQKGMLALPGGFADQGESIEQGCIRECIEETGLEPPALSFVCSAPNIYRFRNITYHTCDMFFATAFPDETPESLLKKARPQESEISGIQFAEVKSQSDIDALPLAFNSARVALSAWLAAKNNASI